MHLPALLAAATAASLVSAIPAPTGGTPKPVSLASPATNPFVGKTYFSGSLYSQELQEVIDSFKKKGDKLNAARARTLQKSHGTFVWITTVAGLSDLDSAIAEARKAQWKTGKKQIVQLVLYNLPSRDCSAGESAGEFQVDKNGLELYKKKFVDGYAKRVKAAPDLTFAIILEPDSLGNLVTNMAVPLCAQAAPAYTEGIAYAISKLQASNIALYIDAAHGGWLGWADNLPLAAAEFAKVLDLAQKFKKGSKIRGFATDVSNFNPYIANPPANYTEWSPSYDEFNYAKSLAPFLTNASLPANFIIDQGRSGLQNQRETWGEWCNVKAGYGIRPTSNTNSTLVDSIVWAKPAGESDGACGPLVNGEAAPGAGDWWTAYAAQALVNANPVVKPTY